MSDQMPIAIIENATRENQRVLKGGLGQLDIIVTARQVKSPALIVVGETTQFAQASDLANDILRSKSATAVTTTYEAGLSGVI